MAPRGSKRTIRTPRYTPTPLERFIDVLQHTPPAHGNFTPKGWRSIVRQIRTGLPFLPEIILSGNWLDWTDGATADAIAAIVAREDPPDPNLLDTRETDAAYVVGVMTGLALAHALAGTTDNRGAR